MPTDLVALACQHSRAVIDTELHRLARRVPSLSTEELNVIAAALEELAESSILAQLRRSRC